MHELSAHCSPKNGYLRDLGGIAILDKLGYIINGNRILENLWCPIDVDNPSGILDKLSYAINVDKGGEL